MSPQPHRDTLAGPGAPANPMVVAERPGGALMVRNSVGRQAARRAPYVAVAGTAITGCAAWGAVEAATMLGQPALAGALTVGTWVATGAGLPILRLRFRDREISGCRIERIPRHHRRRWWLAGGLHALWIDAMAAGAGSVDAVGPWGMAGILLGGTAALSRRWMREHRIIELPTHTPLPAPVVVPEAVEAPPVPAPEPVRFPTPPPPDEGDEIRELWETRVAGGPNPLVPGSYLRDDRVDLLNGYQWVVELDPLGSITATRLRAMAEDIALRLGNLDTDHVDIDRLQDGTARQSAALLTIITRDALSAGVPYRGPRYDNGRIPLGLFADGSGSPHWTARDATGPQHGMVTGGTGSGKSVVLTLLGMAARHSGEWNVVVTDGDEKGRSAPLLKKIAYDFGKGAAEAWEQLLALEAMFSATGDLMGDYTADADGNPVLLTDPDRQETVEKLMPSRGFPGWVWIIDEFHRLVKTAGPEFVERVERLARIIRKFGGAIWIGTQSATLVDWGDNEMLRSLMEQGNCVIMRTKNDTEQLVVGDLGCDPGLLRKGGGYAYFAGDDGRKIQFRSEYSDDMRRWVNGLAEYRPADIPARVYAAKRPPKPATPRADWQETQQRKASILETLERGGKFHWEIDPNADPSTDASTDPAAEQQPVSAVGGDGVALPTGQTAGHTAQPAAAPEPVDERMVAALRELAERTTSYAGQGEQLVAAYRAGQLDDTVRQFAEDVIRRQDATAPQPAAQPPASTGASTGAVPAMTANAERVLAYLQTHPGPHGTGQVAEALGMSVPAASKALGLLRERGEAHWPTGKSGTYAAGRAPAGAAS